MFALATFLHETHTSGMHASSRRAFTLVELSIVLVILGLLVGGVLSGQSLIRAAELRSVTTEKDKYVTALYAFRDKYLALPGDMPNAFAFWGAGCGTDADTANTGCNGNGNGVVQQAGSEHLKLWEHLSLAGLIEGSFDGIGPDGFGQLTTTNTPAAKYTRGYWNLSDQPLEAPAGYYVDGQGIILAIGALNTDEANWLYPLFTRTDAWNIDRKSDDGRANTGTTRGGESNNGFGPCDDATNDPYSIATEGGDVPAQCGIAFMLKK